MFKNSLTYVWKLSLCAFAFYGGTMLGEWRRQCIIASLLCGAAVAWLFPPINQGDDFYMNARNFFLCVGQG